MATETYNHKTLTEEHKRNISKAHKGKIPWNKGKIGIYTEETRMKISESLTGRKLSPRSDEVKRKISEANIG